MRAYLLVHIHARMGVNEETGTSSLIFPPTSQPLAYDCLNMSASYHLPKGSHRHICRPVLHAGHRPQLLDGVRVPGTPLRAGRTQ